MKQLLKRLIPVLATVVLAVAGLVLTAAPASAEQVATSMERDASIVTCVSPCSGEVVGTALQRSLVRSYCLSGSFALIYSQGANRFGFVPRSALVNETQPANNCFNNGGTPAEVDVDSDMRSCAGSSCGTVVGDVAPFDALRMQCQMFDTSFVRWIATFNNNGPQTGFVRSSAFDPTPPTLVDC